MMWPLFGWGGYGGIWMWLMPVLMIVFWGLVIWGIIAAIRQNRYSGIERLSGDSALDILKRRYAKGEISKEEYEERKQVLTCNYTRLDRGV